MNRCFVFRRWHGACHVMPQSRFLHLITQTSFSRCLQDWTQSDESNVPSPQTNEHGLIIVFTERNFSHYSKFPFPNSRTTTTGRCRKCLSPPPPPRCVHSSLPINSPPPAHAGSLPLNLHRTLSLNPYFDENMWSLQQEHNVVETATHTHTHTTGTTSGNAADKQLQMKPSSAVWKPTQVRRWSRVCSHTAISMNHAHFSRSVSQKHTVAPLVHEAPTAKHQQQTWNIENFHVLSFGPYKTMIAE